MAELQREIYNSLMENCTLCSSKFEITLEDKNFYKSISVSEPKRCPECRLMRRLQERNARKLYYRNCDFSNKKIISIYHENQPFPVYGHEAWWSDEWDALDYGQDFDFNRGFFEQLLELKNKVPHSSVFVISGTMENSEFTNCTGYLKNCYLVSEADYNEDCMYSNRITNSKDLIDCSFSYDCELCYECIDCTNCRNLKFSQECINCSDSLFLKNCNACTDCIGCINQRHKQYMIFNKQYSKEEYEIEKEKLGLNKKENIKKISGLAQEFFLGQPHKATEGEQNENVVGDHVYNSKNAYQCFDCRYVEDCKYCTKVTDGVKNCFDYLSWGFKAELMYECAGCGDNAYNMKFCSTCTTNISNLEYSIHCVSSSDLFGCVGLKKKKFCILNKQYDEADYHELRTKIIEHMKKSGEWGEFFPIELCSFGYNETIAMDHFPLTKEEALARGYKWSEYEMPTTKTEDSILCEVSGRPFRITKQEAEFYKKLELPVPTKHPDQRHAERMAKRAQYKLKAIKCGRCEKEIVSVVRNVQPKLILCEECYLKEIY